MGRRHDSDLQYLHKTNLFFSSCYYKRGNANRVCAVPTTRSIYEHGARQPRLTCRSCCHSDYSTPSIDAPRTTSRVRISRPRKILQKRFIIFIISVFSCAKQQKYFLPTLSLRPLSHSPNELHTETESHAVPRCETVQATSQQRVLPKNSAPT